jgi:hypothetical protein
VGCELLLQVLRIGLERRDFLADGASSEMLGRKSLLQPLGRVAANIINAVVATPNHLADEPDRAGTFHLST